MREKRGDKPNAEAELQKRDPNGDCVNLLYGGAANKVLENNERKTDQNGRKKTNLKMTTLPRWYVVFT